MNQERYKQFLIEYTRRALDGSDGTPDGAVRYLSQIKKPGIFSPQEKKTAYVRAQRIFAEMNDRPLWLILKALGLSLEDLER